MKMFEVELVKVDSDDTFTHSHVVGYHKNEKDSQTNHHILCKHDFR